MSGKRAESSTGDPASPMPMTAATLSADAFAAAPVTADPVSALLAREEVVLRRIIQRYVRDASSVDDVFQEVSLKVLRRLDSVRDVAAVRGWLFQLARNAALDHLRREVRRSAISQEHLAEHRAVGDIGRNPSEQLLSAERIAAVRKALALLPGSQREVIRLRVEENLDHEQIAKRLGISRQAVEVRLCRGRAALKDQLDQILSGGL